MKRLKGDANTYKVNPGVKQSGKVVNRPQQEKGNKKP